MNSSQLPQKPASRSLPQSTPKAKAKGSSFDLFCGPEHVLYLVGLPGLHVRLEMHQAVGLGLQEAGDPLGRSLATVPALDLQAMHSAGGGRG